MSRRMAASTAVLNKGTLQVIGGLGYTGLLCVVILLVSSEKQEKRLFVGFPQNASGGHRAPGRAAQHPLLWLEGRLGVPVCAVCG